MHAFLGASASTLAFSAVRAARLGDRRLSFFDCLRSLHSGCLSAGASSFCFLQALQGMPSFPSYAFGELASSQL